MFKYLLVLVFSLTMSTCYCQNNMPNQQNQGYGFLGPNPFDTRYYYPGFALPNDFDPIPDTPRNRKLYRELFQLQDWQLLQLRIHQQKLNQYNNAPQYPNRF